MYAFGSRQSRSAKNRPRRFFAKRTQFSRRERSRLESPLELPGVEFINENGAEQVFAFESRRSRGDESQRRRFCETNPIVCRE